MPGSKKFPNGSNSKFWLDELQLQLYQHLHTLHYIWMMQAVMLLGNHEELNQIIYMFHCGGKKPFITKIFLTLTCFGHVV